MMKPGQEEDHAPDRPGHDEGKAQERVARIRDVAKRPGEPDSYLDAPRLGMVLLHGPNQSHRGVDVRTQIFAIGSGILIRRQDVVVASRQHWV